MLRERRFLGNLKFYYKGTPSQVGARNLTKSRISGSSLKYKSFTESLRPR